MGSEGPGMKGGSRKQLGRRGQRASEEMGVWVWKAGKDRCVQTEKTDRHWWSVIWEFQRRKGRRYFQHGWSC